METPGGGMLGRLGERILGWIALALLVLVGVAIWRMGPAGRAALWSGIWRTGAWLVLAAGLPWAARLGMGRLLELGTNWAGVALLAALAAADALAGVVLMGGLPGSGWGWLAALAALAVAASYNYLVCEYLAERAGG